MFNSFKIGLLLYLNAFFNNMMICLFLIKKMDIKNKISSNTKDKLMIIFKDSILKAFNNSYIILGNLILFSIIVNLIKKYITCNVFLLIFSSLFEVTNSLNLISNLDINFNLKLFLSSFSINFSGLSILFQSFSILGDYKLDIKKILIVKLIFSLISSILLFFNYIWI